MAGKGTGSGASSGAGPVRRAAGAGVSYVTGSNARQTAFVLIAAILVARLLLTNQLAEFWQALTGPSRPLGTALPGKVAAASDKAARPGASAKQ